MKKKNIIFITIALIVIAALFGTYYFVFQKEDTQSTLTLSEKTWIENNKLNLNHWFFSTDLTFYVKGGRVSKTSGFIGNVLNICPLLNVNHEGKLIPREKIRTTKKSY